MRLLLRSTRGLTPTDAGQRFYEHARRAIEEVELAEHVGSQLTLVSPEGEEMDGRLREGLRQVRASTGSGSVCSVVEV